MEKDFFKSQKGKESIMEMYEQLLAGLPSAFEQTMIPTRHGQTFCLACGEPSNPPLILLHGQGANSANWIWEGGIDDYSKHFRVYAIDIIGEPGKSELNRLPFNGSAYADWLMDVLIHLKLQPGGELVKWCRPFRGGNFRPRPGVARII